MKLLDKEMMVESFDELDFTPIRNYLEERKETRNNRSSDEKKKEREENAKFEAYYRYCIVDGELERVSTVMVEPPGIFRGRGDHPLAGKLKARILPEYVTINVGLNDVIPKCDVPGHAWKGVVNKPECTWLGQFKDESKEKAHTKYLFLAADSKIKAQNDIKKYKKAKLLKENIKKIREDYMKKMLSNDLLQAQLGTATYLIDKLALRVGNEKNEDEADTVGCCSLRVEHATLEKDDKITLKFLGKDSIEYCQTIDVLPACHAAIARFKKNKKEGQDLFDLINASKLNDYLKELMPGLSAKVFRTYNASITLQNELGKMEENKTKKDETEEKVKFYKKCNREVAILCNHQKAVPKNYDEQLKRLEDKVDERQKKLKDLEAQKRALKKNKDTNKKGVPKSVSACETAIAKAKKSLATEEYKVFEKKENKNIALSTSKINYMDPRISITWCKNNEVPIEKVFEKTLRMKFAWAMSVEPTWKF
jgi:DNA topoisomerase I